MVYVPPKGELEVWYARLPWEQSQAVFSGTAPLSSSARAATIGWHGTKLNAERGAFAIVRAGGEFEEFIGERVRIAAHRTGRPVIYCYVHELADIAQDISVTRRGFLELAPLGLDELRATVERMT